MSHMISNHFVQVSHQDPWRAAALFVAILFLAVALAACGGDSPEPDSATDAPRQESKQVPDADRNAATDTPQPTETEARDDGEASVGGAGSFKSVSAGDPYACGVKTDGAVACWGDDRSGGATPPEGRFESVDAGRGYTCGVKTDGSVACWGKNNYGQSTPPGE